MTIQEVLTEIINMDLIKLVISNRQAKSYKYQKGVVRLVEIQGKILYQLELFSDKQAFHHNLDQKALIEMLMELALNFKQIDYYGKEYQAIIKYKDINDVHIKKTMNKEKKHIEVRGQNRKKQYILAEGSDILALKDLGIFTKEGKLVNSKYEKYKQINRFIELIDDVVSKENFTKLNIVDFGCGKSYLTFIVYHYFKYIKNIDIHITGLDLKQEVINKCNEIALKYGYENLHFEYGDIKDYQSSEPIDMVITLHACDIATDLALYHAINWQAKMIFSVPCCQHELNSKIASDELALLLKYGIIKERVSALITDSMRCACLEICGYDTQVIEFIDETNSLKNLLIRSVYKKPVPKEKKQLLLRELAALEKTFNGELMLHKLLKANQKIKEV